MSGAKKRILVVEDDSGQRRVLEEFLGRHGYRVRCAPDAETALELLAAEPADLVLMDVRMPGMGGLEGLARIRDRYPPAAVILLTAYADVRDAVEAMRHGAVDYLEKPVDLEELATVIAETIGESEGHLARDLPPLPGNFIVASPGMRRVMAEATLVAPTDATVLITGESGTGKERVAELIHDRSRRRDGPFVRVNCASMPHHLIESELFGHRRGAFTGAERNRLGRFESAGGGTILLDEVGELPIELQPKLLRVLEDGSFERVGESDTRRANARVIACTNRDLELEVGEGRFREDLFWRLNVFRIHLPPLRERREEIPMLVRTLLARTAMEKSRLSAAALRELEAYHWPGNVREIGNVIERAAILAAGGVILPEHLPDTVHHRPPRPVRTDTRPTPVDAGDSSEPGGDPMTVEAAERLAIRRALQETAGNRTRAAKLLGISRRTLLYRLKKYGGEP